MKQATGLKKKFRGCHMMYISQWLELGEGKLLVRFWNAKFPIAWGRTKKVGYMGSYRLLVINNVRSKTAG
jgi:hypothetical protein